MNSEQLFRQFIVQVLKEEKIRTTKAEREEIFLESYGYCCEEVTDAVHDAQTDFVC